MNPLSRWRRSEAARYWLGVARWSILILLVFEVVVRVAIMRLPPFEYESEWGVVPQANSSAVQGREGFGVVHYLSNGEIRTPYDGEGTTVVVLGDSTVEAAQVSDSLNFVSLTETSLRQNGYNVDLHNLGGADRTMADHLFMAGGVRDHFSPDVVVLQVSPSSFSLALDDTRENHVVKNEDATFTLMHDTSSAERVASQNLLFRSGLASLVNFRWQIVAGDVSRQASRIRFGAGQEAAAAGAGEPLSPVNMNNDQMRFLILALVEQFRQAYPDAEIVFLVVPNAPKFKPGVERDVSWVSGEDNLLAALLSTVDGVHVVYVQESFEQFYRRDSVVPRGAPNSLFNFGHLNRDGHRAVALELTDALESVLK